VIKQNKLQLVADDEVVSCSNTKHLNTH